MSKDIVQQLKESRKSNSKNSYTLDDVVKIMVLYKQEKTVQEIADAIGRTKFSTNYKIGWIFKEETGGFKGILEKYNCTEEEFTKKFEEVNGSLAKAS